MGLFDSLDLNIVSNYGPENVSIPSAQSLFPMPSMLTDGQTLIEDRANTSFWNFDQSKITAKLEDVLGSVTQAAAKSGIQWASDSINKQANNTNQTIAGLFRNFQSTQTGAEVQNAAMATRVQNFASNPFVWLSIVGIALYLMLRK